MATMKRALLAPGLAVAMIVAGVVLWSEINGEPFRMTLRPAGDQATVQFEQPDRDLVSPEFPVKLAVQARQVADLRSKKLSIPGCTVEFRDTTIMPGRFQVRVGTVLYDVMRRGIIVDGTEYKWQPAG